MLSIHRRLRLTGALLLVAALLSPPASAQPAGAEAFVQRLQERVRAGDPDAVAALSARPVTFAWLPRKAPESGSGWNVAFLLIPGAAGMPPTPAAVFYVFHSCESVGDRIYPLVHSDAGWRLGAEIPETDTLGYRIRDHGLVVRYDLPAHQAIVTDDVRIERVGEAVGPVILRLSSDFEVDSAALNGLPVAFQKAPGVVALLPSSSREFTVGIAYHGTINRPGSDYVNEKETVLCSYWYPHIARLPAPATVTSTVPKGWTAIGIGDLVQRVDGPESSTFTYRNEVATIFYTLDAGPYVVTERKADGRRLAVYQLKPSPDRAQKGLDELQRSLKFFETHFGPFPYREYTLVETSGPFSGALEAYSFSTYMAGQFAGVVAHELSHTWWGGVVPNPYLRTMWNESFAEYSDRLFRRLTGKDPRRRALTGTHSGQDHGRLNLRAFAVPVLQAFDTENGSHNAVGYGKGAHVLEMFEDMVGTETMLKCMRAFYEMHARGEPADWEEFISVANGVAGRDYSWFFDQWLSRPGVPLVRLANVTARREGSETIVEADVVQESTPPYRLSLPVLLELRSGQPLRATVEAQGPSTRLRLVTRGQPKTLSLDPDGSVLLAAPEQPDGANALVHSFPPNR